MAMQEPVPSAQVVGNTFVEQYYRVLHSSPEAVYRFYQDSSLLSRPASDGTMKTVTTMEAINDMILYLNHGDYKATIDTADSQESHEKGVIVLVTGSLTGEDNIPKKFVQSFFLAPQNKGYYVHNDVLRFTEEKKLVEVNPVMENAISENTNTNTVPLTTDTEEVTTHAPDLLPLDSDTPLNEEFLDNASEERDPSGHEEYVIQDEKVEPSTHSDQSETLPVSVDSVPVAPEDAPKKSYASILKAMRSITISAPVRVSTSTVRSVPANIVRPSFSSAKPAPRTDASAPITESSPENNNVQEEAEGHSVYIRNLPFSATVEQVAEAFKKFGPIKHDGVQVRSNKGFCFGFVEYESLTSMQSAIAASPVLVGDREAYVEEKRTITRVVNGGRGRYNAGGRGGFRNENFRGRGGFGGGRGYGRNDYRNQGGDFTGRPRSQTGRSEEGGYQRPAQNAFGRGGGRQGQGGGATNQNPNSAPV